MMDDPTPARHTWASFAREASKSGRWVAEVLGHADRALTLRVCAYALPEADPGLGFLDWRPRADSNSRRAV
jgi:hypothetical protein